MDKQTKLFLDRTAIKMNSGLGMEAAMQAVLDDDKRIVAEFLNMAHSKRKELANELAESVIYVSLRKAA